MIKQGRKYIDYDKRTASEAKCLAYRPIPMLISNKISPKIGDTVIPARPESILALATSLANLNRLPVQLVANKLEREVIQLVDRSVEDTWGFMSGRPVGDLIKLSLPSVPSTVPYARLSELSDLISPPSSHSLGSLLSLPSASSSSSSDGWGFMRRGGSVSDLIKLSLPSVPSTVPYARLSELNSLINPPSSSSSSSDGWGFMRRGLPMKSESEYSGGGGYRFISDSSSRSVDSPAVSGVTTSGSIDSPVITSGSSDASISIDDFPITQAQVDKVKNDIKANITPVWGGRRLGAGRPTNVLRNYAKSEGMTIKQAREQLKSREESNNEEL